MKRWLVLLAVVTASLCAAAEEGRPETAMKELWRRGHCLLSSVHRPAERQSAVPNDIGNTPVLQPPVRMGKGTLLCYAVGGGDVWAADDGALYRVNAESGEVAATYGPGEGLPGAAVQSIAPDDGRVWLATREGLAVLDVAGGRIEQVEDVRFTLGRVAAAGGHAWVVSDAGAWHLGPNAEQWEALPDFPARRALERVAAKGWWHAFWRRKLETLIPAVLSTEDGLYCICSNILLCFDPDTGKWQTLSTDAWSAATDGRKVWALTTGAVLRYDGAQGKLTTYKLGEGPAAGRPVDMAVADAAFYVVSEPDYDQGSKSFVGGGISRLDTATGQWTVTETVDGTDIRFLSAIAADTGEVWAACLTYDGAVEQGAHPGMAHVKRWKPRVTGLATLRRTAEGWTLMPAEDLPRENRWVMGQKGTENRGDVLPRTVEALCPSGDRVWGAYRMMPEKYYAGYYFSFGCLAGRQRDGWQPVFDARTRELHLVGEQPQLMLISHSHGERIVLAEGHPDLLGLDSTAGKPVAVFENGVSIQAGDAFRTPLLEPFRIYWQATAAVPTEEAVWFGGDAGTLSRLDRKTGKLELVGVVPGRKIAAMAAKDGRVFARTVPFEAVLPHSMADAPELPAAGVIAFDGESWEPAEGMPGSPQTRFSCKNKSSYLYRDEQRVAFLKGVFKPDVLCEDPYAKVLWVGTYSGVAPVPLTEVSADE